MLYADGTDMNSASEVRGAARGCSFDQFFGVP
jgi:hypothetical protein